MASPRSSYASPVRNTDENRRPVSSGSTFNDTGGTGQTPGSSARTARSFDTPMTGPNDLYSPFSTPAQATFPASTGRGDAPAAKLSMSTFVACMAERQDVVREMHQLLEQHLAEQKSEQDSWESERQCLLAYIHQLENTIRERGGTVPDSPRGRSTVPKRATGAGYLPGEEGPSSKVGAGPILASRQTNTQPGARARRASFPQPESKPARVVSDARRAKEELPGMPSHQMVAVIPRMRPSDLLIGHHSGSARVASDDASEASEGVDIGAIDPDLDGIRFRESAVPPHILAQLRPAQPEGSSSPSAEQAADTGRKTPSPSETNRKKHAGHTPNAPMAVLSPAEEVEGDGGNTPVGLDPLQLAALNAAQVPEVDLDEDPPLRGPLILPSQGEQAPSAPELLKVLDSRLLAEARNRRDSDESSIIRPLPFECGDDESVASNAGDGGDEVLVFGKTEEEVAGPAEPPPTSTVSSATAGAVASATSTNTTTAATTALPPGSRVTSPVRHDQGSPRHEDQGPDNEDAPSASPAATPPATTTPPAAAAAATPSAFELWSQQRQDSLSASTDHRDPITGIRVRHVLNFGSAFGERKPGMR